MTGKEIVKHFESCRLKAYKDTGNPPVPTIGWGHTKNVKMGDTCTQEQADKWFEEDYLSAKNDVLSVVKVPLNTNQLDALTSFVYNIGLPQFKPSTLLRKLNAGDYKGAANQLRRWIYDDGVIQPGLVKRREMERMVFLDGM